jgi:hypothetical protein
VWIATVVCAIIVKIFNRKYCFKSPPATNNNSSNIFWNEEGSLSEGKSITLTWCVRDDGQKRSVGGNYTRHILKILALLLFLPRIESTRPPVHDRSLNANNAPDMRHERYERYEEVLEDRYNLAELALAHYPIETETTPAAYHRYDVFTMWRSPPSPPRFLFKIHVCCGFQIPNCLVRYVPQRQGPDERS